MKVGFMVTNRYIDTRGKCETPVTFTEAVVKGLAMVEAYLSQKLCLI